MSKSKERVKLSESISAASKVFDYARMQYPLYRSLVAEEDARTNIIMQKLESGNVDYKEGARLMTQLKQVRQNRKYYNEAMQVLEPVFKFYQENTRVANRLGELAYSMSKVEKRMEGTLYHPKTNVLGDGCLDDGVHSKLKDKQSDD